MWKIKKCHRTKFGERREHMVNNDIVIERTLRKICPECSKYFTVDEKSNGDIVGRCPHCDVLYFEHFHNRTRFIKTVRRS